MVGAFYLCKIGRVIFSFLAVVLIYHTSNSDDFHFFTLQGGDFEKLKFKATYETVVLKKKIF